MMFGTKDKDSIPEVVRIEIQSADGSVYFNPHSLRVAFIEEPAFLSEMSVTEETSLLSARPALVYRTDQVSVPMTGDEIRRLTNRCLSPSEFKALKATYGVFHEIHDDFYDQETGEALQPVGDEE